MASNLPVFLLHPPGPELPLAAVLAGTALGGVVLLGLAIAAFKQRMSRPYLFVALAVCALVGRTVVAGLSMVAVLPVGHHHLLEHTLDVAMIAFVIGAVYSARTVERPVDTDEPR